MVTTENTRLTPTLVSDDLWTALYNGRRTACAQHTAWADHCKHLHRRADEQLAVAS